MGSASFSAGYDPQDPSAIAVGTLRDVPQDTPSLGSDASPLGMRRDEIKKKESGAPAAATAVLEDADPGSAVNLELEVVVVAVVLVIA